MSDNVLTMFHKVGFGNILRDRWGRASATTPNYRKELQVMNFKRNLKFAFALLP